MFRVFAHRAPPSVYVRVGMRMSFTGVNPDIFLGQRGVHAQCLYQREQLGIIEDLAFSPSYYFDPYPPPSPISSLSLFLSLPVCRR
jgi:hypothetical protein